LQGVADRFIVIDNVDVALLRDQAHGVVGSVL
jgi:hypothetical protein